LTQRIAMRRVTNRGVGLDVGVEGEQGFQPVGRGVGEQPVTGVQGPPRGVEGLALVAAVPAGGQLDTAAALVEGLTCQADGVEGVHHRDRVVQLLGRSGLESGEPIHRHDLSW
jgi:hypothetical protein